MKILIINQPLNNRGDEAAHRSLMRGLNNKFSSATITVLFSNANQNSVEQMKVKAPQNTYINVKSFTKGAGFVARWGLRLGLIKLSGLHPTYRYVVKYIRESDLVVCAPGGICMGLFQDWNHIYNLALALAYNKKVAYYSRSFGPFLNETKWDKIFKKNSYQLLNQFDFLSIRDAKTINLADQIGLSYISSVDTAFLDTPQKKLDEELSILLKKMEYVVFVPNELIWHPAFKNCNKEYLDNFYLSILNMLLLKFKGMNIVMLPQLFNNPNISDEKYFNRLKELKNNDPRIIVLLDKYGSDLQQMIISNSKLMVGARYHSIVFAINNEVPFVALSYEHKISGLLQLLGLEKNMYDIVCLGKKQPNILLVIEKIKAIIEQAIPCKPAKEKAQHIANKCLNEFVNKYKIL